MTSTSVQPTTFTPEIRERQSIFNRALSRHNELYETMPEVPIGFTFDIDEMVFTYKGGYEWEIATSATNITTVTFPPPLQRSSTIVEEIQPNTSLDFSDVDENEEEYLNEIEEGLKFHSKYTKELNERYIEILQEAESEERNDIEYLHERQLASIMRLSVLDIKAIMLKKLKEDLPKRKLRECGICFDKKYNFGRLPCCKVSYCMKCLEKCIRCPICRKREWWNTK